MRITIEVSAAEVLEGIGSIKGTLVHSGDVVELVYYSTTLLGTSSDTMTVEIPLKELQGVEYKGSMGPAKILLYPRRLGILRDIPGAHKEKITFQVEKEDRAFARHFVGKTTQALHEMGITGMTSIPFELESTHFGFQEHWGLLYLEEEFVVFDLHSGLSGVTKAQRHVIKMEPAAIGSIQQTRGSLLIRPRKDTLLRVVPGDNKNEVKLKIGKKYRQAADRLISRIEYGIANN